MLFKEWDELMSSGYKYSLIVADPPWKYDRDDYGLSGCVTNRINGAGYDTMSDSDISKMNVSLISEKDSALCLWATGSRMDSAIDIMRAWGFKFKTVLFVWQKVSRAGGKRMVMGNYTRPSTEFILLGTRGRGVLIPKEDKIHNMHQVVDHEIIGHSIKPTVFIRQIETLFHRPVKKLEMFARLGFPNWDLFGYECEPFPQNQTLANGIMPEIQDVQIQLEH